MSLSIASPFSFSLRNVLHWMYCMDWLKGVSKKNGSFLGVMCATGTRLQTWRCNYLLKSSETILLPKWCLFFCSVLFQAICNFRRLLVPGSLAYWFHSHTSKSLLAPRIYYFTNQAIYTPTSYQHRVENLSQSFCTCRCQFASAIFTKTDRR